MVWKEDQYLPRLMFPGERIDYERVQGDSLR